MILAAEYVPSMYATVWALVPPVVAIVLALITKEVYSSLFVGIVIGGLFYGNAFQPGFSAERTVLHIVEDGLVGVLSDSYNVGILIFLVVLGVMVSMMNKAGGSAAFGECIKTAFDKIQMNGGGKTDGTDSRRVRRKHYHASCWWRCHKYAYIYCDTGIGRLSIIYQVV